MPVQVRRKFLVIAGGCLVATLLFAWAAPNLLRWRFEQSNHSARQELLRIDEAIKAYITEHGAVPPTLSSLRGHVASGLSCETPTCDYSGYRFQYTVSSQDAHKPRYSVSAQPLRHGITGVHSFYLDQTGIVRYTSEPRSATSDDPTWPQ